MASGHGVCRNCGREKYLLAGLCGTCLKAARGLTGEAREIALSQIKAKIAAGAIRKGGGKKAQAPAVSPAAPAARKVAVPAQVGSQAAIPVRIRLEIEVIIRTSVAA
jgi:hypothetical protein